MAVPEAVHDDVLVVRNGSRHQSNRPLRRNDVQPGWVAPGYDPGLYLRLTWERYSLAGGPSDGRTHGRTAYRPQAHGTPNSRASYLLELSRQLGALAESSVELSRQSGAPIVSRIIWIPSHICSSPDTRQHRRHGRTASSIDIHVAGLTPAPEVCGKTRAKSGAGFLYDPHTTRARVGSTQ